jgi:hypothetical protein
MRRSRIRVALVAAALIFAALAAPPAQAQRTQSVGISSYIPIRIDHLIGFTPSHGMAANGAIPKPITVRMGGSTYRFVYMVNSAAVWPDSGMILRTLQRASGYAASASGAFVDRKLTASQRRRLQVRLDLGRDADVLAVAQGHPACTTGLTRDQARAIARGTIRDWSAVGAGSGPIALRLTATGSEGFEPRLGWKLKISEITDPPAGARATRDGGLGEAASGNMAIAAVTSWSRARRYASGVCVVSIGGVTPSDETVMALTYPEAYPISYVVSRRLSGAAKSSRAAMKGFVDWLGGPVATEQFRQRGMLLVP